MSALCKRHIGIFTTLTVIGLVCSHAVGQVPASAKKIDEFLSHLEKEGQFMGSVTLTKGGKPLLSEAYGIYGTKDGKLLESTTKTKYRIGSISKTFTTVLVMQLVESGKLKLSDKLSKFYPDIKNAEEITIDHLLRHQSGLLSVTSFPDYVEWSRTKQTRKAMMTKIVAQSPVFAPGEKGEYSNTNFVLLGYIVEDITGKTYGDALLEKICRPLKLTNTYYGRKANADEQEALSYTRDGEKWKAEAETHMSIPHGAGAVVSTTEDLAAFFDGLFHGKLLNADSLKRMQEMKDGLGRGLFVYHFGAKKAVGHNGAIDGFQSNCAYIASDEIILAVVGNGIEYPFNDVLLGVLARLYGQPSKLPNFKTVMVDGELLKKYAGVYSSPDFPLDITIRAKGKKLAAQATGQPEFGLSTVNEQEFKFGAAGIKMKFVKAKEDGGKFDLEFKQGATALTFTRSGAE